jgi:hypothetical protein
MAPIALVQTLDSGSTQFNPKKWGMGDLDDLTRTFGFDVDSGEFGVVGGPFLVNSNVAPRTETYPFNLVSKIGLSGPAGTGQIM